MALTGNHVQDVQANNNSPVTALRQCRSGCRGAEAYSSTIKSGLNEESSKKNRAYKRLLLIFRR